MIKRLTIIQIELEFGNVGFWGEGKTRAPWEKPVEARKRTNKLNMTPGLGIKPGTHWQEVSALTTAPSLLPKTTSRKKQNINNSRHLARKYARIFVLGHYLFREANSFPRAKLEENCELRGTDNVQGQISVHIFAPNGHYCLYYPSNLFRNERSFEN